MTEQNEPIIGYSGFDVSEECYGYNENACYIADTEVRAYGFMREAAFGGEYRIEPVTLSRIMDDFGYSSGEFAMEVNAFARLRAAANAAGIRYGNGSVEGCPDLMLVHVMGVKQHPD